MTSPTAPWGAIFDVDGTMVDNHAFHQQAWIELGRRHGLSIDGDYYKNHIHSRDNGVIVARMRDFFQRDDVNDDIAEEKEGIYRECYGPKVKEMPGLLRFLDELRRNGIPCTVASNAPEPNVRMVLAGLGVLDQFLAILTPGPGLPGKPAPDLFLAAAQAMDLPPERSVVFEDSYSGFLAAEAAGTPSVAILHGASPISLPFADKARTKHADFRGITCGHILLEVLAIQ